MGVRYILALVLMIAVMIGWSLFSATVLPATR